ncbi:lipocalin family protein [Nocardia sp. CA-084685]|uniref:lipocalin family protein n=1 Tax=Nocardia sp. CA-084685 TaxID=3239970 RepID=UPI003D95C7BC
MIATRLRPLRRLAAVAAPIAAALSLAAPAALAGPAPVPHLDLNRYLGTWYQLAAVPQFFNLNCARDTHAEYALDPQGNVSVHNSCTTWAGAPNGITGTATVSDPATDAQLHVSFPGVPTQDGLYGQPNYIVTALGPDYSWALVTDPYRISGFVLARTRALDADQWRSVRAAIGTAGENDCLYLTSPTTGGIETIAPLCTVRARL